MFKSHGPWQQGSGGSLPFQQDVPEARQEGREVVTVACWQVEVLLVTGVQE